MIEVCKDFLFKLIGSKGDCSTICGSVSWILHSSFKILFGLDILHTNLCSNPDLKKILYLPIVFIFCESFFTILLFSSVLILPALLSVTINFLFLYSTLAKFPLIAKSLGPI